MSNTPGTAERSAKDRQPSTRGEVDRPGHVPVGPLSVFNGNLEDAATLCLDALAAGRGMRVATANLDFVSRARHDEVLRADLQNASLVVADGAPVAWMGRLGGGEHVRRVAGVDLVSQLCMRGGSGLRIALYGSQPQTAAATAKSMIEEHGVAVADIVCPPFRSQDESEVAADIARLAAAGPNVVLVALGCPRQERFISEHFQSLPQAVWIGVGGTFDFFAGKRRRAPRVVQAAGAEWLTRLAQEPRRLWRRYLLDDLPGLLGVAPTVLRQRGSGRPGALDELRRTLTGAA